ncbi:MAG: hypothetical protein E7311_07070 [Clostridiales bacterium]|nr:hypothetical protein [Clostridiales bacterium]
MVSVEYSEAAVEVLDILKHMESKYLTCIPVKVLDFLEENKSKTYVSNLDYTKSIEELNLKSKTQAILGLIYLKYWANDEEKIEFQHKLEENEEIFKQEMKEKYNKDNLFKNEEKDEIKEEVALKTIEKQNLVQKIINKIKTIFRR